jgi:hypothetical protein
MNIKIFKKNSLLIPNMNYSPFLCDGIKYILGDDGRVYRNRRSYGEYKTVVGFIDYDSKIKISWITKKEKSNHINKKKDDSGVVQMKCSIKTKQNNGLKNEDNVINEFNNNSEYRKKLCSIIGIPYEGVKATKVNRETGFINKNTKRWSELKQGTGEPSPSPKTDIAIVVMDTNEIICKISLKSGDGRPTSCDYYELNALLNCVIESKSESKSEYINNEILREIISKILNIVKNVGKQLSVKTKTEIAELYNTNPEQLPKEIKKWYSNYLNSKQELDHLWSLLLDDYIDFVRDVFHECLWGNHKFGDNCGRADYLLVTKTSKTVEIDNIIKLNSLNNDLLKYCDKCIKKNKKPFAIKSSRYKNNPYKIWLRFL